MYHLAIPINMSTVSEQTLPRYLKDLKECKANRVFLGGNGPVYKKEGYLYQNAEMLEYAIRYFQNNGLEVGVWIGGFGHGVALLHEKETEYQEKFTQMVGVDGTVGHHACCPLDSNFRQAYIEGVKKIAEMKPDLIQIDDDFRINSRGCYHMGCFCPFHMKEYAKRLDEEVSRETFEQQLWSGKGNRYRKVWMEVTSDGLTEFAAQLRKAVDEIDDTIRMSSCSTWETWNLGTEHPNKLVKIFAGKTKPYARICGAPYWNRNIIHPFEFAREQLEWYDEDVETFTEGDVYPRPRYNVSSKVLELMDFLFLANGNVDGMLNYMVDYTQNPDYETGYIERYIRNAPVREQIVEIFSGKKTTGVMNFNERSKIETINVADCSKTGSEILGENPISPTRVIISQNSIPSSWSNTEYPMALMGENARFVTKEQLKNGAVLDSTAAKILSERGIDTGILSSEPANFTEEYYLEEQEGIRNVDYGCLRKMSCKENVRIMSKFLPGDVPASYCYENEEGLRFYVLGYDQYSVGYSDECSNYLRNYFRQSHLIKGIEWVGKKKLPAACLKHPNLYLLVSKDEKSMSVALGNAFLDDVYDAKVILDRDYSEVKFVNCDGELNGNIVTISQIHPYGFAAFEVK